MKATRPTPIMSADALAAVRFGLRMAFSRGELAGHATNLRNRPADHSAEWQRDRAPRIDTPKNTQQRTEPDERETVVDVAEQALEQGNDTEHEHAAADHDPLLRPVAGAADEHRLHRRDRRHLPRLASG